MKTLNVTAVETKRMLRVLKESLRNIEDAMSKLEAPYEIGTQFIDANYEVFMAIEKLKGVRKTMDATGI